MTDPRAIAPTTRLTGRWLVAAWAAWAAVFGISLVMFIAIEGFVLVGDAGLDYSRSQRLFSVSLSSLYVVVFGIAGAVILIRRPGDWLVMLVALALVAIPLGFTAPDDVPFLAANPGWRVPLVIRDVVSASSTPLLVLLFVFPNGRFVPRWSGGAVLAWLAFLSVFLSLSNETINSESGLTPTLIYLGAFGFAAAAQIYRYRRISTPTERQQTKWVVAGFISFLLGLVVWEIGFSMLPEPQGSVGFVDSVAGTTFTFLGRFADWGVLSIILVLHMMLPISFVIAVMRFRLWDIDVVVNRALVYGLLTASIVGIYVGSAIGLQALFRAATGQTNDVAIVVSTLTIAGLFIPLRRRIQAVIDRRFYRRRYDAVRTVREFGDRVRDEVDLRLLSADLLGTVGGTVDPSTASLWLKRRPEGSEWDTVELVLRGDQSQP